MSIVNYGAFLIFPMVMAYAAVSDLLSMTIPNRLSLLGIAAFVIAAPLAGLSLGDIGLHLAAGAAVLVGSFALFALGWIGGGDAKLAAATTFWLGFGVTLPYLIEASLIGVAIIAGATALGGALNDTFVDIEGELGCADAPADPEPEPDPAP